MQVRFQSLNVAYSPKCGEYNPFLCFVEDGDEATKKAAEDAARKSNDAATKAELEAANKRAADAEAKLKALDDAAKKAADEKAIADGRSKELLAAREAELEAEKKAKADLLARETARGDALLKQLPDAAREAAKVLQGKLSASDFVDYLEKQVKAAPAGEGGLPNPTPGGSGGGGQKGGQRKISPDGLEELEKLYPRDTAIPISKHMQEVKLGQGEVKFTMPLRGFMNALSRRARFSDPDSKNGITPEHVDKMFAK